MHTDARSAQARSPSFLPPPQPPVSLEARGIVHRYGDVTALDQVDLHVAAGASIALIGESGSGKTTLLRCFNRMVEPDHGTITIDGEDVRRRPVELLRRGLGYVPQDGGLLPHWTVQRNVELVPRLIGAHDAASAAVDALKLVGLPAATFGTRFPHQLSGGQRQRTALARAVAARPSAILLDEPFGALDAISRADLQAVFEHMRAQAQVTILLVTHDLAEAARLCDELVVMYQGRVEQRGTLAALRANPASDYVATLLARALASADHLRADR